MYDTALWRHHAPVDKAAFCRPLRSCVITLELRVRLSNAVQHVLLPYIQSTFTNHPLTSPIQHAHTHTHARMHARTHAHTHKHKIFTFLHPKKTSMQHGFQHGAQKPSQLWRKKIYRLISPYIQVALDLWPLSSAWLSIAMLCLYLSISMI